MARAGQIIPGARECKHRMPCRVAASVVSLAVLLALSGESRPSASWARISAPMTRGRPLLSASFRPGLRLRGGDDSDWRAATRGLHECLFPEPRTSRFEAAERSVGRLLDAARQLFDPPTPAAQQLNVSKDVSDTLQHTVARRHRLRGDWRGLPLPVAGEHMVTRSGAARRYNFWTRGEVPWTQWSAYDFEEFSGELVKRANMTQRREWDEIYGIGGHPGWLGWGGLELREYARWLRESEAPTMIDEMAAREFRERDDLGWPLIFTDPFAEVDARSPGQIASSCPDAAQRKPSPDVSARSPRSGAESEGQLDEHGAMVSGGIEGAINDGLQMLASLDWLKGPQKSENIQSGVGSKFCRTSWRPDEDELLISLHRVHGNEWKRIAELLPGRTNHAVKNRWEKLCKRRPSLLADDVRFAASQGTDAAHLAALRDRQRRARGERVRQDSRLVAALCNESRAGAAASTASATQARGAAGLSPGVAGALQPRAQVSLTEHEAGREEEATKALVVTKEQMEILDKYREPVRQRLREDASFHALGAQEVVRRVLVWHNQSLRDEAQRGRDRVALVNDTLVAEFQRRLAQESGLGTTGMEDGLRLLLARNYWEEDCLEAAAAELYQSMVLAQESVEMREDMAAWHATQECHQRWDDLLLERELRQKSGMVYFRRNAHTGALELAHPAHAFNHTQNREFHCVERDPRIEMGVPTEFDTEAAHVEWEESMRFLHGYRPDYTRLTLLVDRQETAAREAMRHNSSDLRLASIDEVWKREKARVHRDAAIRHLERRELGADADNDELSDSRSGSEEDRVPKRRTFHQGGPDAKAKNEWRFGDGHYPYNPSPFAQYVDGRDLDAEQSARVARLAEDARRAAGCLPGLGASHPMPWRQQEWFQQLAPSNEVRPETDSVSWPRGPSGLSQPAAQDDGQPRVPAKRARFMASDPAADSLKSARTEFGVHGRHALRSSAVQHDPCATLSAAQSGPPSSLSHPPPLRRGFLLPSGAAKGGHGCSNLTVNASGMRWRMQSGVGVGVGVEKVPGRANEGFSRVREREEDIVQDVLALGWKKLLTLERRGVDVNTTTGTGPPGGSSSPNHEGPPSQLRMLLGEPSGVGQPIDSSDEALDEPEPDREQIENWIRFASDNVSLVDAGQAPSLQSGDGDDNDEDTAGVDQDSDLELEKENRRTLSYMRRMQRNFSEFYDSDELGVEVLGNPVQHSASLIFLHPEGAKAKEFARVAWHIVLEWFCIRFPQAPPSRGRSWFLPHSDLISSTPSEDSAEEGGNSSRGALGMTGKEAASRSARCIGPGSTSADGVEDPLTLQRSVDYVLAMVKLERDLHNINSSRIFLAGFGQGGTLALAAAMQSSERLGGVFAIGSWFPRTSLRLARPAAHLLRQQPVHLLHGQIDDYLPVVVANGTAALAEDAGLCVKELFVFAGIGHVCHPGQIDHLCAQLVVSAPKPPHEANAYIAPTKWLDYSHSRRTTDRSLLTRRGPPTLPVRLAADELETKSSRLDTKGSRSAQPKDDVFVSDDSGEEDDVSVAPMDMGQAQRSSHSDSSYLGSEEDEGDETKAIDADDSEEKVMSDDD